MAGHHQQAASHQADIDATLVFPNSKLYYQSVNQDHKRLVSAHLRAAEQLEAEHHAACEERGSESSAPWPSVASTDDVPGCVVLHMTADAGSQDELLANLQCRRAALAVNGFDRFPDDPLAIENLDVVFHEESRGTAVMFGVEGDAQVLELRRRVDVIARSE